MTEPSGADRERDRMTTLGRSSTAANDEYQHATEVQRCPLCKQFPTSDRFYPKQYGSPMNRYHCAPCDYEWLFPAFVEATDDASCCECVDDEDSGGNRFRDNTDCPVHGPTGDQGGQSGPCSFAATAPASPPTPSD